MSGTTMAAAAGSMAMRKLLVLRGGATADSSPHNENSGSNLRPAEQQ
jgi:hypothetical protein